jgi:hypothetical protein
MGLVGMGGWFLVVYDWVYPHCKRGCVDSAIFERFSNNLIEFSPFFVVFGRYSLFWTTPGKDSGKFPEVRFPKKHTGKLLLECVVEEHLYKAKIP